MDLNLLWELLQQHKGKVIGVTLGLIFGWFAITYGILKAVFVSICVGVGYYIGKRLDEQYDFKDLFNKIFKDR